VCSPGGTNFAFPVVGGVIQSRNLTPDKTGLPEGGRTLEEFITIMRTGKDLDHIHPPCPTVGTDGCILPTVGDGDLLQVMRRSLATCPTMTSGPSMNS